MHSSIVLVIHDLVIGEVVGVSVSVSEKIGFEKSIGIGSGKNRFRKKYQYRFRKFLVSKKVSVSKNLILVSKNFGIEKSISF